MMWLRVEEMSTISGGPSDREATVNGAKTYAGK